MKFLHVICVFGLFQALAGERCATVDRDRILAADIAALMPLFAGLDADLEIGLAPFPGTHRTFSGHELRSIAKKYGLSADAITSSVCFERAVSPLTAERIETALLATLRTPTAKLDVVDFSRMQIPSGNLEFPRSGLTVPTGMQDEAPALWRGAVRFSPRHTIAIWARVRLMVERPVVVAARDIAARSIIKPEDVAVERRGVFPFALYLETRNEAVGRAARKIISAGSLISGALVEVLPDIEPGQEVHVVASRGAARITFDAVARTGGRKGDSILLLNPESQRTFHGIVDGKGLAHAGPGA